MRAPLGTRPQETGVSIVNRPSDRGTVTSIVNPPMLPASAKLANASRLPECRIGQRSRVALFARV